MAESFIPQLARVYLAAVGATAPESPTSLMPAEWKAVGDFTPDSLSWATDATFEQVRSHQSLFPRRTFQTEESGGIEVDLQEWSGDNFIAVYGGGTLTEVTPVGGGAVFYKFTPPVIGGRSDVAVCIHLADGNRVMRRIVPRAAQQQGVEQTFGRTRESVLPLRLSVLGSDLAPAFYDIFGGFGVDFAPVA